MLKPIRQTVTLTGGSVTLRAWGADVADGHLWELLTFSATLAGAREEWHTLTRQDIDAGAWSAFWRLVHLSLVDGSKLPERLTWGDRLSLLDALWQLNDVEGAEGKLTALSQRTKSLLTRMQAKAQSVSTSGRMMTP